MTKSGDGWSINDDRPSHYDVTIQVPADFGDLASSGKVIGKPTTEQNERIVRLKAKDVRGFTIYASPKWETQHHALDGIELSVHIAPEAKKWAEPLLDSSADVIAFYRKEYGEFPADHLEIICVGNLNGRAHGSSATCNVITIWLHANLADQYRFLIAHEIAHQYFGSSVGIHRKEISWATVGLGMIMDHHYMVHKGMSEEKIRKTFKWYYFEALRRGFDTTLSQPVEKPMKERGIWSRGWNMSLMHGKAYEVCRMLEALLGEKRFKEVIRKILSERKGALLSGADFIDYCEKAYGKPLDWFVADWIDDNLTLDYAVTGVKPVNGNWEVEITKVGDAAFPVVIEAETARGKKLRQRADRRKTVNRLIFATSEKLKSVVIDPKAACPDVDVSNNSWPKQSSRGSNK